MIKKLSQTCKDLNMKKSNNRCLFYEYPALFLKTKLKKHEIQIGFISILLLKGFFFILKEILIKCMYNEHLLVKCFKQKTKNKIIPQKFVQIRHIYLHKF